MQTTAKTLLLGSGWSVAGLCAVAVTTATPALANKTVEIDDVVISAPSVESTTTAELSKYGSEVHVVTREQIEKAGPSADISRVLQMYVPGLYVLPKAGPFDYAKVSLLGGRGDDALILLDGVRLNNRLYGGLYLDTLPAAAVDRVEVLKGGQGLFFGTQAISGVINIITKRASSKEYTGEASIGLDTFKGFNAEGNVQKLYSNGLGDMDVLLYGSRNVSDGYQPFRDRDINGQLVTDKNRSYDLTTAGLKVGQKFGDKARLEVFYQYTQADLDFARPLSNHDTYNAREHSIATTTFEANPTDWMEFFIKGHLNAWDTKYTRVYNTAGGGLIVRNDKDYWGFRDWGVQAQSKFTLPGDHQWVVGVDSQWFRGNDDVYIIDNSKAEVFGYYTQFRPNLEFMPDFHPAFGVRHEAISGGSSTTIWNASGVYDLMDNLSVRGQVGTGFKLPNAEQMFVNDTGMVGNPDLKPEESLNYELGVDYGTDLYGQPFSVSATAFYRKIDNLIGYTTLPSGDTSFKNSDDEAKFKGLSLVAKQQLDLNWALGFDYTRTLSQSDGKRVADIPSSVTRLTVQYDADDKDWGVEAGARFIGSSINRYDQDYGEYAVVDGSAYYCLDDKKQHKLTLLVENLFDREYATSHTKNLDGDVVPYIARPLTAEIRYTFKF